MKKPSLLVLAAGMGSRYGGLKQVDGVGPFDEAIIDYSIFDATRAGFEKVIFIIRKDIQDAFREKIGRKFEGRMEVHYVFQEMNLEVPESVNVSMRTKPWGTAHAVLAAAEVIDEPFAVINADDYYGVRAFKQMYDFLHNDCDAGLYGMIGYVLNNTLSDNGAVSRGICTLDQSNNLIAMHETKKIERQNGEITYPNENGGFTTLAPETLVSMNFFGFHHNILKNILEGFHDFAREHEDQPTAEYFIPLVVDGLIKQASIEMRVLPNQDKWYGVTYREDKADVQEAFQSLTTKGIYPSPLW